MLNVSLTGKATSFAGAETGTGGEPSITKRQFATGIPARSKLKEVYETLALE